MAEEFEFRLTILGLQRSWTYTIPLRPEPIIIGRQPDLDLILEHQQVSRRHAALHRTANECMLVDLNSANGTRLNGQRLTPQVPVVLKPGDSIQIGAFNLDFELVPLEGPFDPDQVQVPKYFPPVAEASDAQSEIPASEPFAWPVPRFDPSQPPPGLTFRSEHLLNYLPGIYHTNFMANFLAIFESILLPIEWQIDNFDLFLDPRTAPAGFLPWLANWFEFVFDPTWSEAQRRTFLKEAFSIYSCYGTQWALQRMLEIYTGQTPRIDDQSEDLPPHTFRVHLASAPDLDRKSIERLIDTCKPIHTMCVLEMDG
jgi:phage tail-like protein